MPYHGLGLEAKSEGEWWNSGLNYHQAVGEYRLIQHWGSVKSYLEVGEIWLWMRITSYPGVFTIGQGYNSFVNKGAGVLLSATISFAVPYIDGHKEGGDETLS